MICHFFDQKIMMMIVMIFFSTAGFAGQDRTEDSDEMKSTPSDSSSEPQRVHPLLSQQIAQQKAQEKQELKALDVLSAALHHLSEYYVDGSATQMDQLVHAALRGMAYSLDPHTMFLTKEQFSKLQQSTVGKDASIGIGISNEITEGYIQIRSVLKGSSAHQAHIQPGDKIVAIDGVFLKDLEVHKYPSLVGSRDSIVRLTILSSDGRQKTHRLRYKLVEVEDVFAQILPPSIGYVRVAIFQENTAAHVADFISSHQQKISALILDLRGNSGGLLGEAIATSDIFIDSGLLLSVVGRDTQTTERHFALKVGTYSDFPMIVLVDGTTASSSEIVAGALQDHERAIIMGQKTFGKGSVQILVPFSDGSGMKMTVARYYTPSGRAIQTEGIHPDLILAMSEPNPKQDDDSSSPPLKEEDLRGHISSKKLDLNHAPEAIPSVRGFDHYIAQWELSHQQDYPLRTAYIYLKAWLKLRKTTNKPIANSK